MTAATARRIDTAAPSTATHEPATSAEAGGHVQLRSLDYEAGVAALTPGGSSYDQQAAALSPVQRRGAGPAPADVHAAAAHGTASGGGALPFAAQIQHSFGHHDVNGISAHVGGAATEACQAMGAQAYASGNSVAFGGSPDLFTAAHEAAHIVQQRSGVSLSGGVGAAGDSYEQHADSVAARVVQGRSATDLLDAFTGGGAGKAGVQRRAVQMEETADSEAEVSDGGELEATDSDFDEYASLADVMGESWEALRDQALDALWDAHFEVHVNLAEISARDAGAAAEIEADVAAGEALADGSLAFEEALLDTAWWTTEGDLVYDEVLADDLDQMVRDVDTYRCLFEAHDELWSIVLAIPWVEGLAEILQAYVDQLKSFGEMAAGAVEANAWLEAFYAEHKEEFDEACLKAGVDVVAMGLGIGAAMCLTGPVGIAAGVTIAVGGLVAKLAIEGELGRVAALKTGFNGVNLTRAAMDHGKDIASVSDDMAAGLKFLGPAMNAMSLVIDGTEAVTERELYSLALAQMQSAERHIAATAAAWEAVQPMIQTAEPLLDGLEKAIGEAGPRIESLRAEIVQIRGQLGS